MPKAIIEPFRIKVTEPIRMTTREDRLRLIREARYNPFRLRADDCLIDLLTDSGTGAMSSRQWAAMMTADESYAGARSWFRFEAAVKSVFGHRHVVPTHQGRASERLLFGATVTPGDIVPGNGHFDTTRANIAAAGGDPVDLPTAQASDPTSRFPFKGNIDVDALDRLIADDPARIPLVLLTVTNNAGGGQPVSLANARAVREICDRYGVPLYLDAARFAENAWLVKTGEAGQAERSPKEIALELFGLADGAMMSMKKDAFGNIGGVLTLNDDALAERVRNVLILTEGYVTYGGLAGRDLDALAVGLEEVLDEDYLAYRHASARYLATRLEEASVPILGPPGMHAIYLDGRAFCAHLPDEQLPGWSLSVALYIHGGIRACEVGNVMLGTFDRDGTPRWPDLDLVRLAIPRRVYTQSHVDYVAEALIELHAQRVEIPGLVRDTPPKPLGHFTAEFSITEPARGLARP